MRVVKLCIFLFFFIKLEFNAAPDIDMTLAVAAVLSPNKPN